MPGLKIVAPSTPHDARALMASAVADPDPVLYYEHIALYRDPRDPGSFCGARVCANGEARQAAATAIARKSFFDMRAIIECLY